MTLKGRKSMIFGRGLNSSLKPLLFPQARHAASGNSSGSAAWTTQPQMGTSPPSLQVVVVTLPPPPGVTAPSQITTFRPHVLPARMGLGAEAFINGGEHRIVRGPKLMPFFREQDLKSPVPGP